MAESIYTQLMNQNCLTPVDGKEYRHELPAGLFPTDIVFESNDQLIEWAGERGYTAKLIQKGLQKAIIEVRATFKSCPKEKVWTEEMGIENLDKLEWKTVDRPNQGGGKALDKARFTDCMTLINTMTEMELPLDKIKASAIKTYGEDIVSAIFEQLELLKG